jgi:hypothetical protein
MTKRPGRLILTHMPTKNATLYDTDFYAWANEQAALLRAGRLSEADVENIAEEIESMGRSEKRELISRLTVLLVHLLKWRYQRSLRGRSWTLTIGQQRRNLVKLLDANPSLKSLLNEALADAYEDARVDAERETRLKGSVFPPTSPFTFDDAISPDFWPD